MKTTSFLLLGFALLPIMSSAAETPAGAPAPFRLMTLDPGHFHAGLLQKTMYAQVDPTVYVYAPDSDDVLDHLKRVSGYNHRAENPTTWREVVYTGPDYLERMLREKPGNMVVISGNNRDKAKYVKACVDAGLNVLADKPMILDASGFEGLKQAFATARAKKVILYDIMTERSEITTVLQREFSFLPDVFGTIEAGTPENPGMSMESVHFFCKFVSGSALIRPAWFFDVKQQAESMMDVGSHLVDLVQWECFPGQPIDYTKDIQVQSGRHWPTPMTAAQFKTVTGLAKYPDYLKDAVKDSVLNVYANGEINYKIKGIQARITARWEFQAPEGSSDTQISTMRGTKCNLVVRMGAEQAYKPVLYIEPVAGTDMAAFAKALAAALVQVQIRFPGLTLKPMANSWQVMVPAKYEVDHEANFASVTERFMKYVAVGSMPAWEEPGMIAKYYTTSKGLELARQSR